MLKMRTALVLQARGEADPHAIQRKMTSSCCDTKKKQLVFSMYGWMEESSVRCAMELCFVCIWSHHILGKVLIKIRLVCVQILQHLYPTCLKMIGILSVASTVLKEIVLWRDTL